MVEITISSFKIIIYMTITVQNIALVADQKKRKKKGKIKEVHSQNTSLGHYFNVGPE